MEMKQDLTASDRAKGFYTPTAGMPGNELSQIMAGVDYGGTMVTGLLFSQEAGWDKQVGMTFHGKHYGASRIKTFIRRWITQTSDYYHI